MSSSMVASSVVAALCGDADAHVERRIHGTLALLTASERGDPSSLLLSDTNGGTLATPPGSLGSAVKHGRSSPLSSDTEIGK